MNKPYLDKIVCPGCGWVGMVADLISEPDCPDCGYCHRSDPERLVTIAEMLDEDGVEYDDVNMSKFVKSLVRLIEEGNE